MFVSSLMRRKNMFRRRLVNQKVNIILEKYHTDSSFNLLTFIFHTKYANFHVLIVI